jgi:hypothetical protein
MYNKIKLYNNQKVDYLILLDHTATQAEIDTANSSSFSPTWDSFSGMQLFCNYDNTLDSSYITGLTSPITSYVIYREKIGENKLKKVAEVPNNILTIKDYITANKTKYRWIVYPQTQDERGISLTSDIITTDWWNYSLTSLTEISKNVYVPDEIWVFDLNIEPSETKSNTEITYFNTFNKYPKASVGELNYLSGSLSCLLGNIDCTTQAYTEDIDRLIAWRKFVGSGKPCIYKDAKGSIFLVNISESSDKPMTETVEMPTTISFTYTQIGDVENISVYSSGGGG